MVVTLSKKKKKILRDLRGVLISLSIQVSMISSSGILVNKKSTSRPTIYKLGSWLQISSEKLSESVTVYFCSVRGVQNGNITFASLEVGVPILDKI